MTHDEIREFLHAYADGELDLVNAREVEQHLSTCDECRRAEGQIRVLREALTSDAPAYRASARLRRKVRAALRREAKTTEQSFSPWMIFATGAACGLILFALVFFQTRTSRGNAIVDQVIANHVRSLLATHLVDIPSSDQHTVKPWFSGKTDFAPEVHDFASDGFPLVGGRLDYLDGKTVAALVYRRDRHVINLLLSPTTNDDTGVATFTRRGYNVIHWTRNGIEYWAASDLNAEDLGRFSALVSGTR